MTIYLASDHGGFELKNHLAEFITNLGFTVVDKGPLQLNPADDYTDYVPLAAEEVLKEPDRTRGIVIGRTGEGEAIAVNRLNGIRAAVYYGGPTDIIRLSREHNDANILSLGADFLDMQTAEEAVRLWLQTPFSKDERHMRRNEKIDHIDE